MKNFTTPWNYANGGGLLVAPINVPCLLSSLLFINFSVAVVLQCSPVYGLEVSNKKYWYGPIPFPPPSFSFTFPFPPLRSPSISLPFLFCPSPSTNQLGGLGEYCNLAQRSLGFSLGRTSIYVIFWAQKTCSMATKLFVCLYIYGSHQKKWRYGLKLVKEVLVCHTSPYHATSSTWLDWLCFVWNDLIADLLMCQSEASPFLSSDVDLAVVAESPRCHGMRQVALCSIHTVFQLN